MIADALAGFLVGFNAAAAPRPWRHRGAIFNPAGAGGFNAATAPRPWRLLPSLTMRARVMRQLQCGHGSKAVETMLGYLQGKASDRLQCGHGSKAVETPTKLA